MADNLTTIYSAKASKDNVTYIYIGQTNRSLEKRKAEHVQQALLNDPSPFHQKIRKIAIDDWKWDGLFLCEPSDANTQEQKFIKKFSVEADNNPNLIVLNQSHTLVRNKVVLVKKSDLGIPRASKQRNYEPSEMGIKFLRVSGKLKPVINLKTEKVYRSVQEAERKDCVSKWIINNSCNTGKKLSDDTRYAYLDLDDKPILTEGHSLDLRIGRNARKIKELTSGIIYNNAQEVADKYELSVGSIRDYINGKYAIAKKQYVFCYLDNNGNEIRLTTHEKALEKIKSRNLINYVVWPVELAYEVAFQQKEVGYFKSFEELVKKLNIKNKGHIRAVCDGRRSHVENYRVAFYDHIKNMPDLKPAHLVVSKKVVRKIQCLNDGNVFNNCSEAGNKYSINPSQVALCARGIAKSVRVKNKVTNQVERFRFAYLDKSNQPILKAKHKEPLEQTKGRLKLVLINPNQELVARLGTDTFYSIADFCRKTGVPEKRANKYLKDKTVNLLGYEFVVID